MSIKITAVGDGVVGKTCLLCAYAKNEFPKEYVPTVFENYSTTIVVDGETVDLTLWDTAGQEDYERLRPLSYPHTNCFLVCFSVEKTSASYENVALKWVPEVRHFNPETPVVIVATKIDLRDDPSIISYTREEGMKMKRKVKANGYMECSALKLKGLQEIFEEAVRVHRTRHKGKQNGKKTCILL